MSSATNRIPRMRLVETPKSVPQYEVRVRNHSVGDTEIEVWEMPSPASPQLKSAVRVAGLRGRNLELVEHRVLRRLNQAGMRLPRSSDRVRGYNITEELALRLGCCFAHLRRCAAAIGCDRSQKASRPWDVKRQPIGLVWPCIGRTRAAC